MSTGIKNAATGTVAVQLGEKQQVLRFNLNTFAILQQTKNISLTQFDSVLQKDPINVLSSLAYCAYLNECDRNDEEPEMSEKKFNALFLDRPLEEIQKEIMDVVVKAMQPLNRVKKK